MNHVFRLSIVITVIIAVLAAIFIVQRQERLHRIQVLLASHAVTDQLQAIDMLQHASFDQVQSQLTSIIDDRNEASDAAQRLLVNRAFSEHRLHDLSSVSLNEDLRTSVQWWASKSNAVPHQSQQEQNFLRIVDDVGVSPWIRRLAALRCQNISPTTLDDLISMPPRDRDGSVMLTVLVIGRHAPPELVSNVVQSWTTSYDVDRQKAATLLAALMRAPIPTNPTQNNAYNTIRSIIVDANINLAWRTVHRSDGMINPDIALAAMIVDRERFLPILVKTARSKHWIHPDHPVELARHFTPEVTTVLPSALLNHDDTRDKWWSLFACGLLKEKR